VTIDVTNFAVCTNPAHGQRRISSVGNHLSVASQRGRFSLPSYASLFTSCAIQKQRTSAAVKTEAKVPIISTLRGFNEQKHYVDRESCVRRYCRDVNAILDTASGSNMRAIDGWEHIDFPASACSLKYGHDDFQMIAAGRHHRIPAGHDARRIASGNARRGAEGRVGHLTPRSALEGVPPCASMQRHSSSADA
jgi:hypothetical protein